VRSGDLTTLRARRRASGLLLATPLLTGGVLAGCSDDEPSGPAISGDSPAEVTVPTVPPTTTEASDSLGQDDEDAEAPDTTVEAEESGAPTTVPPTG
jgi:hypothetical protein